MTVRRTGISGETQPIKKSLGRVLVTIDDLDALRQQLKGNDSARIVKFEFPGGEFSDPGELKQLSRDELQHIDVKTPEMQVTLYHTRASAIGPPNTVESIFEQWAHIRQTKRKPAGWSKFAVTGCVIPTLWALMVIGLLYFHTDRFRSLTSPGNLVLVFILLIVVILMITLTVFRIRRPLKSYAIVVPMTGEELRSHDFEDNRTRKIIWATIGGAIIGAMIGTLATVIATATK